MNLKRPPSGPSALPGMDVFKIPASPQPHPYSEDPVLQAIYEQARERVAIEQRLAEVTAGFAQLRHLYIESMFANRVFTRLAEAVREVGSFGPRPDPVPFGAALARAHALAFRLTAGTEVPYPERLAEAGLEADAILREELLKMEAEMAEADPQPTPTETPTSTEAPPQ